MDRRAPTLCDLLSSHQFQIAILLTSGLDISQIADLLETSHRNVCRALDDILDRSGCRDSAELILKLLHEYQNEMYDERLEKELAALQKAAVRMLDRIASRETSGALMKSSTPRSTNRIM